MCCGHFAGYGEWALAAWYLPRVAKGLRELGYEVAVTQRANAGGTSPSYSAKAANAAGADLALEWHFNCASPAANGTEVMYWHASEKGRAFAGELARGIAGLVGTRLHGEGALAVPTPDERGTEAFRKSRMQFFMVEVCFAGSNETDCQLFTHALLSGEWERRMPGIIDRCIQTVYGNK